MHEECDAKQKLNASKVAYRVPTATNLPNSAKTRIGNALAPKWMSHVKRVPILSRLRIGAQRKSNGGLKSWQAR